jgi:hypothetical protein
MGDIKSTRPSREVLARALEACCGPADIIALQNELLALQHGAEELSHKWRTDPDGPMEMGWCANELEKLFRGEPCA